MFTVVLAAMLVLSGAAFAPAASPVGTADAACSSGYLEVTIYFGSFSDNTGTYTAELNGNTISPEDNEITSGSEEDSFSTCLQTGTSHRVQQRGTETNDGTLSDPEIKTVVDENGNYYGGSENGDFDDDGGQGLNSDDTFTISDPNDPPTADATVGDTSIVEGQTANFDGSGSSDPDGDSLSYGWSFGDGGSSTATSPSYTFPDAGGSTGGSATYTPSLTVDDGNGGSDSDSTATVRVYNDFDGDGLADDDSATGVSTDSDDDDDGISDSNDPAPYNVYPSASDSSSESTEEDSTLTVGNGDSADLTELATDGYESYDPNIDPISIEQVGGGSFSAGSTVTLDSGATVTVESDGSWTYDPNGKYENLASGDTATDEFTYTVSDDAHSGTAAATEQGTVSITINGVNDAPTAPTDDNGATNEVAEDDGADTAVGITASSTDPDDGDAVSYSLTNDANGAYKIDSSTGKVSINDPSKIDYEAANSQTITVEASDGTAAVTDDFTITVTDIDETPTFTATPAGSVAEDDTDSTNVVDVDANVGDSADTGVSYAFDGGNSDSAYAIDSSGQITINDATQLDHEVSNTRTVTVNASEGGQSTTETLNIDVTDVDESPSFTATPSGSVAEDDTDSTNVVDVDANVGGNADESVTYAFDGGNSDSAYAIDSSGQITINDATQLDHEVSNTRTVTVNASEGGQSTTETLNIDVTDVAETPTFTSAASNSVDEDKTNGATVHDVDADVDAHGTQASDTGVSYAITGGNVDGAFAIDSSTGQVTVDNASAVETELRTNEDITFTVEATEDQQTQTQTITVDITQVDEVPAFTSGTSASVPEDAFSDVLVQDVQADVGGDSDEDVTYAITGGNSAGLFKIDSASGELTVDDFNALDHEDVASVTLTVEASEGSESDTQDVTVDVTDVDETPSILTKSSSPSVAEDAPSDTQIHNVDATVDYADSTVDVGVTYALVGGNADNAFAIDSATGELTVDNTAGVEAELYSERTITVKASEGSESDTQDITVDISQVDEVPEFSSDATGSVAEDATDGTAVHDVEADVGGDSDEEVTYAITGGNNDNAYAINAGSGQITINDASKLNHEVSSSRTVTVTASEGSQSATQDIDIDVIDADEQPSFTSSASATVSESDSDGASVQNVNANVGGSDDESVSYAITGGNDDVAGNGGGAFAIDPSTGQITISDTADIDESRQSSFSLTVEASEGTATTTQDIDIDVTDDVAPTFQSGASSPADGGTDHAPSEDLELEFGEDVTLASGDIRVVDEGDASSSETLAVSAGSVTVSNSTVTVSPSSTLESDTSYHVEIDSGAIEDAFGNSYDGFSDSTSFAFQTADTVPTFTSSNPTVTVDEDGSVGLTSVLEVRDVSRSDDLTWTVLSTPSNGSLTGVDDETQSISGVSSPHTPSTVPTYTPETDFADGGTPDDSFTVKVADTSPGTSDTVTVDVTVEPINDQPSFQLPANPNRSVGNNASLHRFAGFLDTSAVVFGGNGTESDQNISEVIVDNDRPALFSKQPDIDTDGVLTFTPAQGVQGTATVDVRVVDDGATSNGGTAASAVRSFTITVDNRSPEISSFSVSNPDGQDVAVSFDSDQQLSDIHVSIDGAESATLTESDFTATADDGNYTYRSIYSGATGGDYTATLEAAEDNSGNDGALGQSGTVTVPEPRPYFDVFITNTTENLTAGETAFVRYRLTNTGEEADEQEITLRVHDRVVDTTTVALEAGERTTGRFTHETTSADTPSVATMVASANESDRRFMFVSEPKADAAITGYKLSTKNLTTTETLQIEANVENTGDATATLSVPLVIDGQIVTEESVEVDANATETVSFEWTFTKVGTFTVTVGGLDATVVTHESDWWDPYVNEDGVATLDGALDAIDNYETGELSLEQVLVVIDSYQEERPIAELLDS